MADINRSAEWVTARLEEVGTATEDGTNTIVTSALVDNLHGLHADLGNSRSITLNVAGDHGYPMFLMYGIGRGGMFAYFISFPNEGGSATVNLHMIEDYGGAITSVTYLNYRLTINFSNLSNSLNILGFHEISKI